MAALLMKLTPLPKLRRGVCKVEGIEAHALLEISVKVVVGLIKTFGHHEKRSEEKKRGINRISRWAGAVLALVYVVFAVGGYVLFDTEPS